MVHKSGRKFQPLAPVVMPCADIWGVCQRRFGRTRTDFKAALLFQVPP